MTNPPPASPTPIPAWSDPELSNPHGNQDKPTKVRSMFGAIAGSYDLNNRLHSFGLDQRWRNTTVRIAGVKPGDRVLDMACGTGDLTEAFARTGAVSVTGGDFTPEMLVLARQKQSRLTPEQARKISYVAADAMNLQFETASFDVLSIAFGIRNVAEPKRAIAEFARVLRPGGRLVILEFDKPRNPLVRLGNDLWCEHIMPRTATWVSGDRSGAYKYLPRSVTTFMSREEMVEAIGAAGFENVTATPLTFGVCVCYRGIRAS